MAKAIPAVAGLAGGILGAVTSPKGGGTSTSTSQQTMELPGWVTDQAKSNLWEANEITAKMPGPYKGQRVADLTPTQQTLAHLTAANIGSINPLFAHSLQAGQQLTGYNAPKVTADMLRDTDLSGYMSPYADAVKSSGLRTLERGRLQGQNTLDAGASMAKAFGGSRGEIQKAVLDSENARQKADFTAGVDDANFKQAQAAAVGDITRKLGVDQGNQAADLSSAGMRLNAATGLAGIGSSLQQNFLNAINAAMGGQTMIYANDQAKLDAKKALYDEERMDPVQRLQIKSGILSATPYGYTQTGMQQMPMPQGNPFMSGLGGASSMLGLVGQLGGLLK
jgi:murein L,D-transpeptidase YcbB/YkuD